MCASGLSGCARTHRTLCEEQVRITCELAFRCCTPAEATFVVLGRQIGSYATTEGECIERLAPACRGQDVRDDAVVAGRLALDATQAQLCVDALAAARDRCDLPAYRSALEASGPCGQITIGLAEDGDACELPEECGAEGFCQPEDGIAGHPGICFRPGDAGDSCAERACASGLVCSGALLCELPPGAGEPCPQFACAEGNLCAANGTCEPLPGDGEPCDFACARGLFCNPDADGEGGLCEPEKAPGAPCFGSFGECGDEVCLNGRCTGNEEEGVCAGPA